jgi:hypothetical protein
MTLHKWESVHLNTGYTPFPDKALEISAKDKKVKLSMKAHRGVGGRGSHIF